MAREDSKIISTKTAPRYRYIVAASYRMFPLRSKSGPGRARRISEPHRAFYSSVHLRDSLGLRRPPCPRGLVLVPRVFLSCRLVPYHMTVRVLPGRVGGQHPKLAVAPVRLDRAGHQQFAALLSRLSWLLCRLLSRLLSRLLTGLLCWLLSGLLGRLLRRRLLSRLLGRLLRRLLSRLLTRTTRFMTDDFNFSCKGKRSVEYFPCPGRRFVPELILRVGEDHRLVPGLDLPELHAALVRLLVLVAPQAHFDPVWGLAKWCVRRPLVTLACVSRDFVCEIPKYDFSKNWDT